MSLGVGISILVSFFWLTLDDTSYRKIFLNLRLGFTSSVLDKGKKKEYISRDRKRTQMHSFLWFNATSYFGAAYGTPVCTYQYKLTSVLELDVIFPLKDYGWMDNIWCKVKFLMRINMCNTRTVTQSKAWWKTHKMIATVHDYSIALGHITQYSFACHYDVWCYLNDREIGRSDAFNIWVTLLHWRFLGE